MILSNNASRIVLVYLNVEPRLENSVLLLKQNTDRERKSKKKIFGHIALVSKLL